jgi:hypothetical protein
MLGCALLLVATVGLATGGLTLSAFFRFTLAWLIYALFCGLVGLWFSTRFRGTLLASLGTLVSVLLVAASPVIVYALLDLFCSAFLNSRSWQASRQLDYLGYLSPPVTLVSLSSREPVIRVGNPPYTESWTIIWLILASFALLDMLLWLAVCRRFRHMANRTGPQESVRSEGRKPLVAIVAAPAPVPSAETV